MQDLVFENTKRSEIHSKAAKLQKKSVALKSLGEKSCEIKGGGQEMAAMTLMQKNFNNGCVHCNHLLALTSLQPFLGHHL